MYKVSNLIPHQPFSVSQRRLQQDFLFPHQTSEIAVNFLSFPPKSSKCNKLFDRFFDFKKKTVKNRGEEKNNHINFVGFCTGHKRKLTH